MKHLSIIGFLISISTLTTIGATRKTPPCTTIKTPSQHRTPVIRIEEQESTMNDYLLDDTPTTAEKPVDFTQKQSLIKQYAQRLASKVLVLYGKCVSWYKDATRKFHLHHH
jgi:hypothetical protein